MTALETLAKVIGVHPQLIRQAFKQYIDEQADKEARDAQRICDAFDNENPTY